MAQRPPERADVYTRVTEQIVKAIEDGSATYTMPWHSPNAPLTMPVNAATGNRYRGVNVLSLWASSHFNAYPESRWATYIQWAELGKQVVKGEKATVGVFWKPLETNEGERASLDVDGQESSAQRWVAKAFPLFNVAQTDGYLPPDMPSLPPLDRIEHAERFFASLGADIRHGGSKAYYQPSGDFIQMPPFEIFLDQTGYYSTLAHEATHWTAHKSRLERDLTGRFGTEGYAAEELVAELGSAFLCADLVIELEPRQDHAAYIQSWLKLLKNDHRAIFTAAGQAQKAADYLHSLQPQTQPSLKGETVALAP